MSQQQVNNYHHLSTQTLVNQQWSAPHSIHNHYYAGAQGSAAPSSGQNGGPGGPQLPVPDAYIPGFTHVGYGVQQQQPRFGGTNVHSHTRHVCPRMENATDRQQEILHILCNDLVERSQHRRDCGLVGETVSRDCVKLFVQNEKKAREKFWRRAQKTESQRKGRAKDKQQKARAKQPDLTQQWSASTSVYHQLMQATGDNAGGDQANMHNYLNGMLPEGMAQLDLDVHVPPGLALTAGSQMIQQNL